MLVQKFLEKNNINLDFDLSSLISDAGADGSVYNITNNQVLKLSAQFDWNDNLKLDYKNTCDVLSYLSGKVLPSFANVYSFAHIGRFNRTVFNDVIQNYVLYYYTMEKLNPISEDEKRVFHTLLSHEDNNVVKNYSKSKVKEIVESLHRALDFDKGKVMMLCDDIRSSVIEHNDLNPRNIMKNDRGDFKLIDFDRCELR